MNSSRTSEKAANSPVVQPSAPAENEAHHRLRVLPEAGWLRPSSLQVLGGVCPYLPSRTGWMWCRPYQKRGYRQLGTTETVLPHVPRRLVRPHRRRRTGAPVFLRTRRSCHTSVPPTPQRGHDSGRYHSMFQPHASQCLTPSAKSNTIGPVGRPASGPIVDGYLTLFMPFYGNWLKEA